MPSNSFFRATHKLVVKPKRFEPPTPSEPSSSPNGKTHSSLTKAILKPFKDLKAKIESKKSKKTKRTGLDVVVPVPARSQQSALIIHPTASSMAHATFFKMNTIIIIEDILPKSPIERVLPYFSLPALPLVHIKEPTVTDSDYILRILFQSALGLLDTDKDLIAHLFGQVNHWKSIANRSIGAGEQLLLAYVKLQEQDAGLQNTKRVLQQQNINLNLAHANHKSHCKQKRDQAFAYILELAYQVRAYQAQVAYIEAVLKDYYRALQSERSNAEQAKAQYAQLTEWYNDLSSAYQETSTALHRACDIAREWEHQKNQAEQVANEYHAHLAQAQSAWANEKAAHDTTRDELASALELKDALIYESQRIVTERNEMVATHDQEMQTKDDRIAALEKQLAALRVEKSLESVHGRKWSNSSTTLSAVSSGVLFSSTASDEEVKALSPRSPSTSADGEAVDEAPVGIFGDFISKTSIMENFSQAEEVSVPAVSTSEPAVSTPTPAENEDDNEGEWTEDDGDAVDDFVTELSNTNTHGNGHVPKKHSHSFRASNIDSTATTIKDEADFLSPPHSPSPSTRSAFLGNYLVELSLTTDPVTNFTTPEETDSDYAESESSYTPEPPSRVAPSENQSAFDTHPIALPPPAAIDTTPLPSAPIERIIKKPIAPSKRATSTKFNPPMVDEPGRGYAMKESDLSENWVDIFAPVLPVALIEVDKEDKEEKTGGGNAATASDDVKKPKNKNKKNRKARKNKGQKGQNNAAPIPAPAVGHSSKGYSMKESELNGNTVDIFGPINDGGGDEVNDGGDEVNDGGDVFKDEKKEVVEEKTTQCTALVQGSDGGFGFSFGAEAEGNPFVWQ